MALNNYSDKELKDLLAYFAIPRQDYVFRPLTDGYINDTFLVLDDIRPLFILQRINHLVFPNITGLMNNVRCALHHLSDTAYQRINLVETLSGNVFHEHPGPSFWRLMSYIDGSTAHNTSRDPVIAKEAGRIIGKFHSLLHSANTSDYVDTIPGFHDLEIRKRQFDAALSTADKSKLTIAQKAIQFAKETLKILDEMDSQSLPIRICHNDTKLNNILFSKDSGQALCLIDLDTLMKGHFHFDFGDAVRTIVNTAPEDEKDHDKITFEKQLFEAFVDGLASNGPLLSKVEIEALPLGAILMPFLHGIRALTDYLNNNKYYKVAYENQNLDRCFSLFDFTKKALHEVDYMSEVVNHKLQVQKK